MHSRTSGPSTWLMGSARHSRSVGKKSRIRVTRRRSPVRCGQEHGPGHQYCQKGWSGSSGVLKGPHRSAPGSTTWWSGVCQVAYEWCW